MTYTPMKKRHGLKYRAWKRFKGKCAFCQKPIRAGRGTVDHMLPKSRGGKLHMENVAFACGKCNRFKGDLTPLEWMLLEFTQPSVVGTKHHYPFNGRKRESTP